MSSTRGGRGTMTTTPCHAAFARIVGKARVSADSVRGARQPGDSHAVPSGSSRPVRGRGRPSGGEAKAVISAEVSTDSPSNPAISVAACPLTRRRPALQASACEMDGDRNRSHLGARANAIASWRQREVTAQLRAVRGCRRCHSNQREPSGKGRSSGARLMLMHRCGTPHTSR
jgi:hypothetical protein